MEEKKMKSETNCDTAKTEQSKKEQRSIYEILEDYIVASELAENEKTRRLSFLLRLRSKKVNLLVVGPTGVGKSSTINALFNAEIAKVGAGVDPETISLQKYELDNLTIWDTPGLGDNVERDQRIKHDLVAKLNETGEGDKSLVDLVLVLIDASTKDLGTSYELINNLLIPTLGADAKSRIIVALNQADMAMKGQHWNREKNEPDEILTKFLEAKVISIRKRIKEATGLDLEPVYYCAGYIEDGMERHTINQMIIPAIETDIPMKSVTVDYLDRLLTKLSTYSKSAGSTCRGYLSVAFKDAVKSGIIAHDPVRYTKTYPRERANIRIFNEEELKSFLKIAADSAWYLEILFAVFCGMRKSEIRGLKFKDIDFANETVFIQRQIGSDYKECELKTENSKRVLHLHAVLLDEIRRRKDEAKKRVYCSNNYHDFGYVSFQSDGKPHSPSAMNIALTKLCQRNGLPVITVHGLRHQYATILLEQGVSIERISALLGHASVTTTYEYYLEVMDAYGGIISFMNNSFKV